MALYEDLDSLLALTRFHDKFHNFSENLVQQVSMSMANTACSPSIESDDCRDDAVALKLKVAAMGIILLSGIAGIVIPLVGKKRRFLRTDSSSFVLIKAFAAGVILATGFVHMLSDAQEALTDPCLPRSPWSEFPFPGFVAMMAALGTLVLDFLGTQFYERKHRKEESECKAAAAAAATTTATGAEGGDEGESSGISPVEESQEHDPSHPSSENKSKDPMHIVGIHAHAAAHSHSHPHSHGPFEGCSSAGGPDHQGHSHGHVGIHGDEESGPSAHVRHVVVSQILELGIVSHSVIIGLSLGVSQSPCTIRPLVGALAFHQFFEGFALGGCISQAQYGALAATVMACFFAVTTPTGVAAGAALSSVYNSNSPRALVVEGMLDSVSAGILIYMALVDLIAADFLNRSTSCSTRLQVCSYVALFLGAGFMSLLALWA